MRHTRAHTANRRSHHALKNMRISVSAQGVAHPRHKAVLDGSQYRGRSVMDKASTRVERARKAAKRRDRDERPGASQSEAKAEEPKKKEPKVKLERKKLPEKSREAK